MKRISMIVLVAALTTAAIFADMPITANQLPMEAAERVAPATSPRPRLMRAFTP